ncbi:hypothetical protein LPJ53_004599 [Coemansia erecta]|uniref:CUE domain-containing protein n=1 Tax=Coemansia erecta TaxID=147472 RepID=A0A9W7XU15_9FUNG|nr:hypothetical protein LPJ53_004599 [Coemansia erecta]
MADEFTRALASLHELFPEMDKEVVETVLRGNAGLTEPSEESRIKEMQKDAELARRLLQRDMAANQYRQQQQQQARSRNHVQTQPGPQHYMPSTKSRSSSHTKTSTRIRNMFRLGSGGGGSSSNGSNSRRETQSPGESQPGHSSSPYSRQQYGADDAPVPPINTRGNRRTLDSDFGSSAGNSDADGDDGDEEANRPSKTPTLPTSDNPAAASVPIARMPSDVFAHLDTANDLSAAYVPLSPSGVHAKYRADRSPTAVQLDEPVAQPVATARPLETGPVHAPATAAAAAVADDDAAASDANAAMGELLAGAVAKIDLEHPFDSNPLLPAAAAGTQPPHLHPFPDATEHTGPNPFVQEETNPFRARKPTL